MPRRTERESRKERVIDNKTELQIDKEIEGHNLVRCRQ